METLELLRKRLIRMMVKKENVYDEAREKRG